MSDETKRDIDAAAKALEEMASAVALSDLRTAWESFLFRIERAWDRAERVVKQQSGGSAQSWLRANAKLRRADPLLQYLKQASNAETHAITHTVESDRIVSISDRFGRPFTLNQLKISLEGKALAIDLASHDVGIDWTGKLEVSDPQLQAIVMRGKRYAPPTRHLGNKVESTHPVFVATLGINFYKGAYAALEFGAAK